MLIFRELGIGNRELGTGNREQGTEIKNIYLYYLS
jgi:hypothetical protein